MTSIYLDLIATTLFFLFIGYLIRNGIPKTHMLSHLSIQKLNQLVYRNYWLLVLPFFYSITLISDLENYLKIKPFAIQIVSFFLLILFQILIFLRIQPLPFWIYLVRLKDYLSQFYLKFFTVHLDSEDNKAENNLKDIKRNISFGINEISFLVNSFAMPALFILTNSYFLTKLSFLIFNL